MECEYGAEMAAICIKMANIDRTLLHNRRGGEVIAQLEGLLQQYEEVAAKTPKKACTGLRDNLLFNIGCAYEQGGNLEKAVQIHEELLQLNPNDHQAMYNAGTNLVKLDSKNYMHGRLDRAITLLRKAVELNPGNPDYRQNLEDAQGRKNRLMDYADIRGDGIRQKGPIC